jgi:hypothetical protein
MAMGDADDYSDAKYMYEYFQLGCETIDGTRQGYNEEMDNAGNGENISIWQDTHGFKYTHLLHKAAVETGDTTTQSMIEDREKRRADWLLGDPSNADTTCGASGTYAGGQFCTYPFKYTYWGESTGFCTGQCYWNGPEDPTRQHEIPDLMAFVYKTTGTDSYLEAAREIFITSVFYDNWGTWQNTRQTPMIIARGMQGDFTTPGSWKTGKSYTSGWYYFWTEWQELEGPEYPDPSAAVTGTMQSGGVTESEVAAGGETIIITLSNDTWDADVGSDDNATTQLLANITGDLSEAADWSAEVQANWDFNDVSRDNDNTVTITLPATSYDIGANEVVTIVVSAASVASATTYTASPTLTISKETPDVPPDDPGDSGLGRKIIYEDAATTVRQHRHQSDADKKWVHD